MQIDSNERRVDLAHIGSLRARLIFANECN